MSDKKEPAKKDKKVPKDQPSQTSEHVRKSEEPDKGFYSGTGSNIGGPLTTYRDADWYP